ncbi:MAG: hypothetical protein JNL74_16020, partial [Fibrobacteres bacterium]|nr:hypothetical protein [Fibrobacterota bacterium]
KSGDIKSFKSKNVTRWWVNALFLTLDRLILRREAQGLSTKPEQYPQLLASIGFLSLSGPRSVEKELAQIHITKLYELCGGVSRFSTDHVRALVNVRLPDIQNYIENDHRPGAAIHYSNPSILKTIPRACALLAKHAGFDFIDADDLENFNVDDFVKEKVKDALAKLKQRGTHPTMTAADLMKLTRDQ